MGTRGSLTFVVNGDEKTAYNQWDSYPDGIGVGVLRWLRDADLPEARRQARELRVVDPSSEPTPEDIERFKDIANLNVGERELTDWYVLLRETQGAPGAILRAGVIEDARDFPCDSLFCEWGYVIDFDGNALEVYEGFQSEPHDRGRFAKRSSLADRPEYYPIALAASWPMDNLPSDEDFLAAFADNE
ncbi:hypothetical protein [Nocardiopsis synnemataformans]|uniref:hypothetical protein n=1 Tax=Nocardiopsis synnemataformans TaxID=61305 RepID=UPI003EBE8184